MNALLRTILALLLAALLPLPGGDLRIEEGRLVTRRHGYQLTLASTAEGPLRITVREDGRTPAPLPQAVALTPGTPAKPRRQGGFALGAFDVLPEEGERFAVALARRTVFHASVSREGGLSVTVRVPGSRAFHGFGQVGKQIAWTEADFTLRHEPRYGDQTYLYLPFVFSSTSAGFLFNAAGGDRLQILEGGGALRLTTTSGKLDLYAWQDADPLRVLERATRLTGSRSLLPRWAFGYLQSRYGYRSEAEVRATVAQFQRLGIPLSAIVLDLYWFKRMGDLDWNREAFPDPEGLAAWLRAQGVRLITISEPFFTKDAALFPALEAARGLAVDAEGQVVVWKDWWDFGRGIGGGVLDPTAAGARRLLADRYATLAAGGVDGFWIDLGEPEHVPAEARFGPWSEVEYHNAFNLAWAGIVREGFLQARPGRRPFLLSRSGTVGIAGLGVSTWSGDVPATWKGLRDQLPLGLSASLSGLPFWGSDVGGFITRGGEQVLPDPELYLRWHQFGAFTPVYRAHGHGAREPWIFGPEWTERVKAVIARRQRLLPYVYATAYQAWAQGLPMMRPLFVLDPERSADASAFLFGDAMLVAPVTQPLGEAPTMTVRLPPGGWYDAFTLERHEGGHEVQVPLTLDRFPLFYREGAIVPIDAGQGQEGLILIPGAKVTRFTVFSDDGETEAYREGAGERLEVELSATGVTFRGAARERAVRLHLPSAFGLSPAGGHEAGEEGPFRVGMVNLKPGTVRIPFVRR